MFKTGATRRETILAGTAMTILAGIGISPASAESSPYDPSVDRELRLSIGDGFSRQTWIYGGQTWHETRDVLSLHEDEVIRVTVANDRPGDRVISFGDDHDLLLVRQGEVKSVVLRIDRLSGFSIAVAGQPMISRTVQVRPNYGAHANVV